MRGRATHRQKARVERPGLFLSAAVTRGSGNPPRPLFYARGDAETRRRTDFCTRRREDAKKNVHAEAQPVLRSCGAAQEEDAEKKRFVSASRWKTLRADPSAEAAKQRRRKAQSFLFLRVFAPSRANPSLLCASAPSRAKPSLPSSRRLTAPGTAPPAPARTASPFPPRSAPPAASRQRPVPGTRSSCRAPRSR